MSVKLCLFRIIRDEVKQTLGVNAFISRMYIIKEILSKLEPTKPDDETCGFIAYNVPNNPYERMKLKTGKFLTRKLNLNSGFLNDSSLRKIADAINVKMNPDCNYRLDNGSAIYGNYRDGIGGGACMSGGEADKVELYVDNPKVYQQAILELGGDSARAMVIRLDNGDYLMDRIYTTSLFLKEKMRDIAKDNQWYYRTLTGAGDFGISDCRGCSVQDYSIFVVRGLKYNDGAVPYQDTLTRYNLKGDEIRIQHLDSGLCYDGILDSTDGYIADGNSGTCYHCESMVDIDDLLFSEVTENHYCESCHNELFSTCQHCEEALYINDLEKIEDADEYWCEDCVGKHVARCVECNELNIGAYYIVEDAVYCGDCVKTHCYKCVVCNELFLELNDEKLCRDCQTEKIKISEYVEAVDYAGKANFLEI